MVAPQGFEPRLPDPESDVLPLDQGAKQKQQLTQIQSLSELLTHPADLLGLIY